MLRLIQLIKNQKLTKADQRTVRRSQTPNQGHEIPVLTHIQAGYYR